MIQTKQIDDYLSEISKRSNISKKKEKRFLKELEHSIDQYIKTTPDCTMADIIDHFGSPDEIFDTTLEDLEPEEIMNKFSVGTYAKRTIFIVAVAIVLLFSILIVSRLINRPTEIVEIREEYDE